MYVVVRYHEIALKGRNRPFFVGKLAVHLRGALGDLAPRVRVEGSHLAIDLPDTASWDEVQARIARVFGVANFGRFEVAPLDVAAAAATIAEAARGRSFASFRVRTRRTWKDFPRVSTDIDREIGNAVNTATGARVDLSADADLTIHVEIRKDSLLWSLDKLPGPGGFAVGSSGRVLALLSGGIDSPVAAWRMMKRGCRASLVHFHAFPLQDRTTIDKARTLAATLARWQLRSRLLLVPFGTVQQTIVASCPAALRVVLYRRFMVRIAETLCRRVRAKAIVTGESLGQVASQTLDNVAIIDEAARGPVLRPLIGMDKDEITDCARRIGTYDTSTLPDQDCCQLFVPKSPTLSASLAEVRAAEAALDVRALVEQAIDGMQEERFAYPPNGEWVSRRGL